MLINGPFDMNQFLTLTTGLQNKLNATFNIITTGKFHFSQRFAVFMSDMWALGASALFEM